MVYIYQVSVVVHHIYRYMVYMVDMLHTWYIYIVDMVYMVYIYGITLQTLGTYTY